jgi:hypothetical protein
MDQAFDLSSSHVFHRSLDWPVDIGIAAGTILGYVFTWIGLVCYLYLEHWMAGLLGALAGGLVGWLWFLVKVRHATEHAPAK